MASASTLGFGTPEEQRRFSAHAIHMRASCSRHKSGIIFISLQSTFQGFGLHSACQGTDDLIKIPFQDRIKPVEGQSDTVVSNPVLRKVVGSNPFTPVPGPDLGFSILGNLLLLLLLKLVQEPGPKDFHALVLVF